MKYTKEFNLKREADERMPNELSNGSCALVDLCQQQNWLLLSAKIQMQIVLFYP